ncbi:MAG TPA: transcription antitermination factor NusB [Acidimicrobiales bacterium]|nr:transcription antitermination factor NusB [Acidimicrobiales bacterium]
MTGSRRVARERALALLYEAEAKEQDLAALVADLPVPPDSYALELVEGVAGKAEAIDGLIGRLAPQWPLERMPAVDRNLLRLAVYELAYRPEIPVGVVIDEAIELAKQYSTEDSGRFVNGVLSAAAAEVR